jgi:hypothetical protein
MRVFPLLTFFMAANAFGWGQTGHRAVGEIAQSFLSTEATIRVHQILGGQSLARVSTWPDEIKSEPQTYQHTFIWHYTDWPDDMHEHTETGSSGQLMTSINDHLKTLKDPSAVSDKKAFALKFLVHLIGDLHMPLHVGNATDVGGNACKVTFHGSVTNLHALWDEKLIDRTSLSFTELSRFVRSGVTNDQITEWKKGSPLDWALESKEIRNTLYPEDVVTVSTEATSSPNPSSRHYCRRDITIPQNDMPKLGYEYSYKFMPVVERRIFQAGIRLARLLEEALIY